MANPAGSQSNPLQKYMTSAPTSSNTTPAAAGSGVDDNPLNKYMAPSTIDAAFSKASEIRRLPSVVDRTIARGERVGALALQGVAGDVPFLRKAIPEKVKGVTPAFDYEEPVKTLSMLGRDIFLLKGANKLGLASQILRGAGVGMATANTEKPEEMAWSAVKGAMALPILNKGTEVVSEKVIAPILTKALKSSRQAMQDLVRSGFMVEKGSVQRAQEKGIGFLMDKTNRFRDSDAFLKLGEQIHNSALELRKYWGDKVGRWRGVIFRDPRIQVDISNPTAKFISEIEQKGVSSQVGAYDPDAIAKLNEIRGLLQTEHGPIAPDRVYLIIDRLDDMISRTRTGDLSLGKNAGRVVANLARDLKQQVYKSVPRSVANNLRAVEAKFGEVAQATDDVFGKLQFAKEGVASKERIGATELALRRGLKAETPTEERAIWEQINKMLPKSKQFMEHYKDVSAAQDFSQEGIGWLFRRLLLSPRMAGAAMGAVQPIMKAAGAGMDVGGKVAKAVTTPIVYRKTVPAK